MFKNLSILAKGRINISLLIFIILVVIGVEFLIENKMTNFQTELTYEQRVNSKFKDLRCIIKNLQEVSTDTLAMGERESLNELSEIKKSFLEVFNSLKSIATEDEDKSFLAEIDKDFPNYYNKLYKMANVGVEKEEAILRSHELMETFDSASEKLLYMSKIISTKIDKDIYTSIKYNIKSTQEVLTDILAVGDIDGLSEVEEVKKETLALIGKAKKAKTSIDELNELEKTYLNMLSTGIMMAKEGITVAKKTKEAKKVMEEVDTIASKYQNMITAITDEKVKKLDQIVSSVSEIKILIEEILVVVIVLLIIITIVSRMVLSNIISRVLDLKEAMEFIINTNDFTKEVGVKTKDEISMIRVSFNKLIKTLNSLLTDAKASAFETASVANELSSTADQVGERVENEANILDKTVKEYDGMKIILDSSVDEAKKTKEEIEKASINLEEAKSEILSMVAQIQKSSAIETELSNKLNQLSVDAGEVKSVLTIISDIADQTNLLALNAAIEAARAGEHGRGFAVVADEVRQLAERTQKSLHEINTTINVIVQAIIEASEQMNHNAKSIQDLALTSDRVEDKINETSNIMQVTSNISESSLIDTLKIVDEIQKRVKDLNEVNSFANSNARSVEEIATATEHLHEMTEELSKKLCEFKT